VYPHLRDHACVADYPPVPGMRATLYLLEHDKWEDSVKSDGGTDDDMSKSNKYVLDFNQ
jgi:hypothetical protein